MVNKKFRLEPFVFKVKGITKAALYDLYNERLLPITNEMNSALDKTEETSCDSGNSVLDGTYDAATLLFFNKLMELGFGRFYSDVELLSYQKTIVDISPWKLTTLGALSISSNLLSGNKHQANCLARRIQIAKSHFMLTSLYFYVEACPTESDLSNLSEFLSKIKPAFKNLWFIHKDKARFSSIEEKLSEAFSENCAINFESQRDMVCEPVSPARFVINFEGFRTMKELSLLANALHIKEDGVVTPCIHEPNLHLGSIWDLDLAEIVKSEACQNLWLSNRDKIQKCQDCEFRYCCVNPMHFRENKRDFKSAPNNCFYNPYLGEWENHKSLKADSGA